VAYGISSSLSGVQGIIHVEELLILVAPLFKTQFISQVEFASLPCELCPLSQLQLLAGPSI